MTLNAFPSYGSRCPLGCTDLTLTAASRLPALFSRDPATDWPCPCDWFQGVLGFPSRGGCVSTLSGPKDFTSPQRPWPHPQCPFFSHYSSVLSPRQKPIFWEHLLHTCAHLLPHHTCLSPHRGGSAVLIATAAVYVPPHSEWGALEGGSGMDARVSGK